MPDAEPGAAVYDVSPADVEVPSPPQDAEFPADDAEYGLWDPKTQTVQPLPGPTPSSEAPGTDGGTSEQTVKSQVVEFDPRCREDFEGLLYIGALTAKFSWLGHTFVIRTLKTDEVIEIGLLTKDYLSTDAWGKAYQAAVLGASVLTVDGKEPPLPLTAEKDDTLLRTRMEYVMRSWFPPTLDAVYERYGRLEVKAREVIAAMGNRSG